jgi:hypothetical protein
MVDTTSIS